jgi:type IV pilus assembly protein PilM
LNWKRIFNLKQIEVMGLDIGSSAVKIVALHKDNAGYVVTTCGIAEIGASKDGKGIKNAQQAGNNTNTVKAIRDCFAFSKLRTKNRHEIKSVVCGVSGPEVAVRNFEFPLLPTEEIEGAVTLEASQVCPFNAADIAVDHQLIPNGNDKTRGFLVAATNTLITDKTRLAKAANLKCILMDVDGLALLNCFNNLVSEHKKAQAHQITAILNVGASHTTLAIMNNNGQPFVRDTNYAGEDIIKQIAAENVMSIETIKGILSNDSTTVEPGFHNSLEKACQKLISDIDETLRYYTAQSKSSNVEKLFVCGGFALARGFVELLNNRLGAEVVLWNPFDKISCKADGQFEDVLARTGPALAVAAGLAMRTI